MVSPALFPAAENGDSEGEPAALENDELVGRCLNDTYFIEGVLGEGGVGRVYRARHVRIRTKSFALKVLHPEFARDPQQLARFQREAEAAATLSHPNVVGVFDVGRTSDGLSYLACELLRGTDLDVHLDKVGKLDFRTAIEVALQICDALETAHGQSIVHRDLKPQNVFLLSGADGALPPHPVVKVLDFGLSRFLDHTDAQLTKTGAVMGTPAFMAPEQATGERGDHRVDVYGIGVILYAALTGRPPFDEETLPATLVAVMTADPPRPRKVAPEIPEALELVIQRAMAKKADERYPNVAELRRALETILDSSTVVGPEVTARNRSRMGSSFQAAAEEAQDLRTARPQLLLYGLLLTALCIAFSSTAVGGLEIFTGPFELSNSELALMLAGICGTVLMPAFLAIRHFKKTIWSNSAKVMAVLARVRSPLIAGIVTYGAAAATVRFCDEVLSRFGDSILFFRNPGASWPGFTWLFPLMSVVAGGAAYSKRRWGDTSASPRRRFWLGTPLTSLTMLSLTLLLFAGLQWRKTHVLERAASAAAAGKPSPTPDVLPTGASPEAPPPEEPQPVRLASDDELTRAIEKGVDGLLPLSESYPKDPSVLEPLLLAFSSRATGLADAMATAKRLVEVAPEYKDNPTLGIMVKRAARTPGNASELAFALMKNNLGSYGADLLYELSRDDSKASAEAEKALQHPEVKEKFSPALRVALDLHAAASCEARLPLLARAKNLGDSRSSAQLAPLAQGTKKGCGKWKNKPCPAPCQQYAAEYQDAVEAIKKRASATSL